MYVLVLSFRCVIFFKFLLIRHCFSKFKGTHCLFVLTTMYVRLIVSMNTQNIPGTDIRWNAKSIGVHWTSCVCVCVCLLCKWMMEEKKKEMCELDHLSKMSSGCDIQYTQCESNKSTVMCLFIVYTLSLSHTLTCGSDRVCNCSWAVFLTLGTRRRRVRSIKNRGERVSTKTIQHYVRTNDGNTQAHSHWRFSNPFKFNDKCFPFRSLP